MNCRIHTNNKTSNCELMYREQPPLRSSMALGHRIRGGSPFIPIDDPSYFLTVVHSTVTNRNPYGKTYKYHHHLLLLHRPVPRRFEISWMSEAFRLPRGEFFQATDVTAGIQFALSIARDGDALVIGYGDLDCEAHAVRVQGFFRNMHEYIDKGLGTHINLDAEDIPLF